MKSSELEHFRGNVAWHEGDQCVYYLSVVDGETLYRSFDSAPDPFKTWEKLHPLQKAALLLEDLD